ncbi:putative Heterokaryon incompatibility domain-containing protein [Seiridium unicorne]|uniref:Heterokaryon incompatibility domain-containing protein n=1 Tax=Seiridium unicorne TaxID=138068 RepID=A0ABR2V9Y9_9PEZI
MEVRDHNDGMPLLRAVGRGDPCETFVRLLLEKGANIEARDINRKSPLCIGVALGAHAIDTITLLLENGADIEARDNDGRTPLLLAIIAHWGYAWEQGLSNTAVVKLLLEQGADIEVQDCDGTSAAEWDKEVGMTNRSRLFTMEPIQR